MEECFYALANFFLGAMLLMIIGGGGLSIGQILHYQSTDFIVAEYMWTILGIFGVVMLLWWMSESVYRRLFSARTGWTER